MIINENQLFDEFQKRETFYKDFLTRAEYYLKRSLSKEKNNIKVHSLPSRIKSFNSFLEKIQRKKVEHPFEEIHDIVAFRIVCLYLNDIEKIKKVVQDLFNVFEVDDKIKDCDIDRFGYMDLKLKAKLKDEQVPDEIPSKKIWLVIPFEIQIRTIAQDAWASISHHLNYKKEEQLPYEIERDLNALSGLFYVADTHFSLFPQKRNI